ncbi:hypothetical protein A3J13_00355 [Candidatus Daviesbacteria bacterium RIFCSPLOWO2_02_FULL_36_8]|uniref:Uncharacterized protein n=1 Tax=Candidatus Daviesbacteria bacterium RIFCSPLOWO2_02_FULL_36_8 TaxID=1797793 RepID=A0A1F5MGE4_9BACT|nr:MAG: hypothetical protein A3J13_00355 [Candidatus Daviesbacteria bacterium RIFCSPLOWO2_02_FULL_36_8]
MVVEKGAEIKANSITAEKEILIVIPRELKGDYQLFRISTVMPGDIVSYRVGLPIGIHKRFAKRTI